MYSTNENIVPLKEKRRIYSIAGEFPTEFTYDDKFHTDLRGITEIVSDSLELLFSPPELYDGTVYITAKGIVTILGVKENGELEAQSTGVNIRIPFNGVEEGFFNRKLKWFTNTSVCSYEITLSGGELHLTINTDGSAIAFNEDYADIVNGYEKTEENCDIQSGGFALYYPQKGENIWNVTKEHKVSYEKFKMENDIHGMNFEKSIPVILR